MLRWSGQNANQKVGTDKMPTTEISPDKMPTYGWHYVRLAFCPVGILSAHLVTSCLLFLFSLYSSFPISIFTYPSNRTAQWSYQWWWPLCVCLCVCPCLCVYACALIVLVFNVFIIALVSDLIGGGCWIVASYLLPLPLIHPTQSLPSPSPKLLLFA